MLFLQLYSFLHRLEPKSVTKVYVYKFVQLGLITNGIGGTLLDTMIDNDPLSNMFLIIILTDGGGGVESESPTQYF